MGALTAGAGSDIGRRRAIWAPPPAPVRAGRVDMYLMAWLPRRDDEGATSVEYGLIVVAIAAVIAVIVFLLGDVVVDLFDQGCDGLSVETAGAPCP